MDIAYTLRHGLSRQIQGSDPATTTIGQLLSDDNNKAILRYGESVDAVVDGVVQSLTTTLEDLGPGATIMIETRSNSKA